MSYKSKERFPGVLEIAKLMVEDESLVRNWKRFYRNLYLEEQHLVQLDRGFSNRNIESYDLFVELINIWSEQYGETATIGHLVRVLRNEEFNGVADKIVDAIVQNIKVEPLASKSYMSHLNQANASESLITEPTTESSEQQNELKPIVIPEEPISFEVRESMSNFVGRRDEIYGVMTLFFSMTTFLVTVSGMGGIGKSELAKRIGWLLFNDHHINTIWLNVETLDNYRNAILRLEEFLRSHNIGDFEERLKNIIQAFEEKGRRTLLILDNLEDYNTVRGLLTQTVSSKHFFVVVTTRIINVLDCASEIFKIDCLNSNETLKLIESSFGIQTQETMNRMNEILQGFPLALQQTISFIKTERHIGIKGATYSLEDYLNDFTEQKEALLSFPLKELEHEYKLTTIVTWNISIERIRLAGPIGIVSLKILDFISYFEAENIPFTFISKILYSSNDQMTVSQTKDSVALLRSYSLINVDNFKISVHRLVQEVMRLKLAQNLSVLLSLLKSFENDIENIDVLEITHVLSVWKYCQPITLLIEKFRTFPYILCNRLNRLKLYEEMFDVAESGFSILSKIFDDTRLHVILIERQIGEAMYLKGQKIDALERYRSVFLKMKKALGIKAYATIGVAYRLGVIYYKRDCLDEALDYFKVVLEGTCLDTKMLHNSRQTVAYILLIQKRFITGYLKRLPISKELTAGYSCNVQFRSSILDFDVGDTLDKIRSKNSGTVKWIGRDCRVPHPVFCAWIEMDDPFDWESESAEPDLGQLFGCSPRRGKFVAVSDINRFEDRWFKDLKIF